MQKLNSLDIAKAPSETRVVVAMSGGVDSSVVAALLKHEGYDVVGVTLQLYDHGAATYRVGSCCAGQDIADAKKVCNSLNIPHYVLNYEKRFHEAVIQPFVDSYLFGETPIPCVSCNQTVKFADLLVTAKQLQADVLATGHYVVTRPNGEHRALYRPVDSDKDQSYFLFATTQEQLDFLRFPLGLMPKSKVRAIAEEMGLLVAKKQDSQDICFVPQGKYSDIVAKLSPEASTVGQIVDLNGRVLGTHKGIANYTIGQRRGLGIAVGEALYVIKLDRVRNRVIVGPEEALKTHRIGLRDVNWLGDTPLSSIQGEYIELFAKVRSAHQPRLVRLHCDNDLQVFIEFLQGERGIAPGQACVFYDSADLQARVLGGGFIKSVQSSPDIEAALTRIADM